MSDLSPAAEAVFDALNMSELNGPQQYMALSHVAAALRAIVEHLEYEVVTDVIEGFKGTRRETISVVDSSTLLSIANELEGE